MCSGTPETDLSLTLNRAILGTASVYTRPERLTELLDIIYRIQTEFRGRIETRDWLTEDTRAYALENVEIDGFTQEQRSFLAWANLWATQTTEDYIRTKIAVDPHSPGSSRGYAPLLHVDAFYEVFNIEEGDPMWLPPEQRLHAR